MKIHASHYLLVSPIRLDILHSLRPRPGLKLVGCEVSLSSVMSYQSIISEHNNNADFETNLVLMLSICTQGDLGES